MIAILALLPAFAESPAEPTDAGAAPIAAPDTRPRKRRPAERFGTSGFRTNLPAKGASVSTRIAFVQDFDGPTIGEATLRGHYGWQSFGVAVETAATAGTSAYWSSAGWGNTVVDLRGMFGRGSTHAIGARVTLPTGAREASALGNVTWWGTVPEATVPIGGGALAYEGATRRWAWHAHVGLSALPYTPFPDLGASLTTVQPLAERWFVVAEVEARYFISPFHVRALARHTFGDGWTTDAGFAVPLPAMIEDPTLQLLARLERRW